MQNIGGRICGQSTCSIDFTLLNELLINPNYYAHYFASSMLHRVLGKYPAQVSATRTQEG